MNRGREALMAHEADFKTYKEVPDLHPLYEEKYELFIKNFEQIFGKDYNPQYLQKTWKHFWDMTLNTLQEKEWKEKKIKLQEEFKKKYSSASIPNKKLVKGKGEKGHTKLTTNNNDHKTNATKLEENNTSKKSDDIKIICYKTAYSNKAIDADGEIDTIKSKATLNTADEIKDTGTRGIEKNKSKDLKQAEIVNLKEISGNTKVKPESENIFGVEQLSVDEDFKRIYLESCSKILQKSNETKADNVSKSLTNKTVTPISIAFKNINKLKRTSSEPQKDKKEDEHKILVEKALHHLESISNKIGVMGPALLSIVETARKQLKISSYDSLKVFADKESELLVNIAITKLNNLMASSSWSEAELYRAAISIFQKVLSEAKEIEKKPPKIEEKKPTSVTSYRDRVDLQAIARATVGFDAESMFAFIKNTFLYKGLEEPSKDELYSVYKDVSALHFKMAMSNMGSESKNKV